MYTPVIDLCQSLDTPYRKHSPILTWALDRSWLILGVSTDTLEIGKYVMHANNHFVGVEVSSSGCLVHNNGVARSVSSSMDVERGMKRTWFLMKKTLSSADQEAADRNRAAALRRRSERLSVPAAQKARSPWLIWCGMWKTCREWLDVARKCRVDQLRFV